MRIVLAGGGTAGHIFPTLAVARRLRGLLGADAADLTIVCGSRELDRELYRGVEFDLFSIRVRGIVGVGSRGSRRGSGALASRRLPCGATFVNDRRT